MIGLKVFAIQLACGELPQVLKYSGQSEGYYGSSLTNLSQDLYLTQRHKNQVKS